MSRRKETTVKYPITWLLASLVGVVGIASCGGDDDDTPDEETICDDDVDNDEDDATDCDDDDCADDPACAAGEGICDNGIDDDGDGPIDCDDSDCAASPACTEQVCDNGADDDGDGLIDCDDTDCADDPVCQPDEEVCDNGTDDDGDGSIDCDDADCDDDPACQPDEEVCDNGADDDSDGDTDCDDADCDDDPACQMGDEDCDNETDDDEDGLADCMDDDCDGSDACPEACNGEDDDGDGRIDELPDDAEIGTDCYEGPAELAGIGQCVEGAIECFGGELICLGWVGPSDVELCDGLDNDCDGEVPAEEAEADCSTLILVGHRARIEVQTEVRDVDVQINLDTTGSMGGELETLRSTLRTTVVPTIRSVLPTSQFGVSTFDDFPVNGFGGGEDTPFTLHQRVTSNVGLVQAALDAIPQHGGNDGPESGIESLYQIASGEGTTWPRADTGGDGCPEPTAGLAFVTPGIIDPSGDDDAYTISLGAGATLSLAVIARNAGSTIDSYLYLRARGDGSELDRNDDSCDLDSSLEYTAEAAIDVVVVVQGFGDTSTGWYALQADVDGVPYVADPGTCSALEVGGDPFESGVFDPARAVALAPADDVYPRAGAAACVTDCTAEIPDAAGWVEDFCNGIEGGAGVCGNDVVEADEECDDGNTIDGDGCDSSCRWEMSRVDPFDWRDGFDPGLGHGSVGGVGFRETALPVIVHITDAVSHECTDYADYDIDAHCSEETFDALEAIGARVVAVASGASSIDPTDLLYPLGMAMATGAIVPVCAFDGSDARTRGVCAVGQCCTGISGASVPPDADGNCPLVFQISGDGSGLDTSIVNSLDALTQFVRYSLTAEPRDFADDDIDALCFIESIGIQGFEGPAGTCAVEPEAVDTDGDDVPDTLRNATPRTRVTFEISAVNQDVNDVDDDGDTDEPCADPGTYVLFLDVVAEGGTVVATREVTIEVPEL
jgi:hypothetical protein